MGKANSEAEMNNNLPAKRWAIQYENYVYLDRLWNNAHDAIIGEAILLIPREEIDKAAKIVGVEFDDIVHAMWRKAKREGSKLRRVTVR